MRPRSGRLFPVVLMLLLALISFWLERVVQLGDVNSRGPKRHEPDYTVDDFTMTQTNKEGAADTTLTATRMVHFADDETTELESPRLVQQKKGDPPVEIVARLGKIDRDGNVVQLIDDVVATRAATPQRPVMHMMTRFMEIHIPEEIGTTPEKVVITQGESTLEGIGMIFWNKTRDFELHGQVQGTYVREDR
jgi:lipopolysaccharide export system protein LptC